MTTEFFVFADSREAVGGDAPLHGVRPGDGRDVVLFVRQHEWERPIYLMMREEGETRWSFALLNPERKCDDEAVS